jgi:multicomponent Na+:H+ antiporter subunit F
MMLLFAAMIGVLTTMVLALARAFLGPTLYDRILAINMFGTKTVIFVALIGFLVGRPQFLDIAVFYALVNFVGIIAVLKLTRYRELDAMQSEEDVR